MDPATFFTELKRQQGLQDRGGVRDGGGH